MNDLLTLEPIKNFIHTVGKDVQLYFGRDSSCIVHLKPDGAFYGIALHHWLKKRLKNLTLTSMEDDGEGLEEQKVRGRKVLIIDNDIITGKGYKRAMEALRVRKAKLGIRDIKFACHTDRIGLADFSVWKYSPEAVWHLGELNAVDLKLISLLGKQGRMSFAELAKQVNLSQVAVKHRVDNLLRHKKIITIEAALNSDRFYTMSGDIFIEADMRTADKLIEGLEGRQDVYHIAQRSGRFNLTIGILAESIEQIEKFITTEIRSAPGVKQFRISLGELPLMPKTVPPRFS